jgi:hypothetical protein
VSTSTAIELSKRRALPRGQRTPFSELAAIAGAHARRAELQCWPSTKYQADPVAFAREVLGLTLWSKQIELLEAIRNHKRVAAKSGHKVSKSHTLAIASLWFFCSFPDARVVMSSVTSRQVDAILWRELRKMHVRSSVPIDGDMHELARSGFKARDFREIVGFTAREAEAVAGISGANLLYLLDEASGIDDDIFEAIEGNRAGGARLAMTSNPTRTDGEFFEAFNANAHLYHTHGVLGARHRWRGRIVPRPPVARRACSPKTRDEPRAPPRREPSGDGQAAFVLRAAVLTSSLTESGVAERVAPNILSVAHWERLGDGELYAPLSRLDWATLLKRTFAVDVRVCARCGGPLLVRAVVTDPAAIAARLDALRRARDPPAAA